MGEAGCFHFPQISAASFFWFSMHRNRKYGFPEKLKIGMKNTINNFPICSSLIFQGPFNIAMICPVQWSKPGQWS